jgi:hypothetical protein
MSTSSGRKTELETTRFSIIKEKTVTQALDALVTRFPRLRDLEEAMDWALSRGPSIFSVVESGEVSYYLWKTDSIAGLPGIRVLFTVNEVDKIVNIVALDSYSEEYT